MCLTSLGRVGGALPGHTGRSELGLTQAAQFPLIFVMWEKIPRFG